MPIPTFKFKNLTRTDLLQFDGVNFVNVPVYAVGKNVMWGPEGVGYNSLIVGDVIKNISLVGHKHTTDDILGLQELINDLGVNSSTNIDLSKYLLTSTFIDHVNNINSAKHVTQEHLDKLNNYWQLDEQGNLYTTYNTYSTQELSAWKNGDYSSFTFSLGTATDVELSGLVTDDLLKYNGTKWVNVPMSSLGTGGTEYILPTASATTLGGIKVGNGLTISSGVLSVIGGGGGGSTVVWGALTNGYRQLTVDGVTYALAQNTHKHLWEDITDKPSTFAPSAHTHSASDISSGTFAIARIPTGTTSSTVALGNHLHTGVYEPVFSKNTAFNKNFGAVAGTVAQGNDSRIINGQTAYGWGNHASAGYVLNSSLSSYLPLTGGTLTGNLTAPSFIGSLTGNADTATKLQTAITIAGVSFDGTANIAIPFANLSSKPTTLSGYGITDAVTLNTAQTISGTKTFTANVTAPTFSQNSALGGLIHRASATPGHLSQVWALDTIYQLTSEATPNGLFYGIATRYVSPNRWFEWYGGGVLVARIGLHSGDGYFKGNVGIGEPSPTQKLHVAGNILATGTTTTTKVIFNAAGWSMEQVGSELQMKHNNLIAARFLPDGSIVGLGEITAYGASTGGEGVSLLRTGGTMTGNLTMSADIIMNSGRAIGVSNLPLKLLGNALTYNASNVLTEANTATQIKMGNGWTIEQTVASLTIRKDGVIKGTFNA